MKLTAQHSTSVMVECWISLSY